MRTNSQHDTFLQRYAFVLSDDPSRFDMDWVLDHLVEMYWFKGEPRERIRRAIKGAHPYGLYAPDGTPAGFLSVLSDHVYNARLSNLFIIREHQGRGLGRWIMSTLLFESRYCDVRNWQLATDDMHGLYERFGFRIAEKTDTFMTLKK